MPLHQTLCQACNKLITNNNIKRHKLVCKGPKQKKTPTEVQLSIDPEIRRSRAIKANLVGQSKRAAKRNVRIATGCWDDLSWGEKRQRILIEQDYKCSECLVGQIYNSKPLEFELDHISGKRQDNTRENLRLLCPNCHSQTPTYKGRNCSTLGEVTYTDDQIIHALKTNSSGYQAINSLGMNPHGRNYRRIRNIIKKYGLELPYAV
jgi:Zn finger protein HypA/HybF involved in hydrogenase expression